MTDSPSVDVRGVAVDAQTRCAHYATPLDVVALRFACCTPYWPCHLCHAELADHAAVPVPRADFGRPRVLCGVCRTELSVHEYRAALAPSAAGDGDGDGPACPCCGAGFNPGCAAHSHLYFDVPAPTAPRAEARAGA